jgi:secernin
MCDTMVVVPERPGTPLLFGKSSDREPGEAQLVEAVPATAGSFGLLLSRPFWMRGCEMGANDRGVVGGNEAVFTRLPVERTGMTGMELLRLALERASSAGEAVDVVTELLARHAQGGRAGHRDRAFRYHNSFLFADAREAWVLETAARFWAAQRAHGVRTISNVLTIGEDADRLHPEAADEARRRGWRRRGETLSFARAFGSRLYRRLTGGELRRACTRAVLEAEGGAPSSVMAALRSHGGRDPADGLVMRMPCAHAAGLPTRAAGQTTGSMVSALSPAGARHWLTGTSSPCLSIFKPAPLDGLGTFGPPPGEGFDDASLFWRHERLHRLTLVDYETRAEVTRAPREALERAALAAPPEHARELWERHREALPGWIERARAAPVRRRRPLYAAWWRRQSRLDRVPDR